MRKKYLKLGLILIVFLLLMFAGYNYIFFGGERDLKSEKPSFLVTSKSISDEFITNIDLANKKYLEKAVAITGEVTSVKDKEIIMDNIIICSFKNKVKAIQKKQKITVKGRIIGFDDLMGELKIDQCSVSE